jgi:hypothetical protein
MGVHRHAGQPPSASRCGCTVCAPSLLPRAVAATTWSPRWTNRRAAIATRLLIGYLALAALIGLEGWTVARLTVQGPVGP